MKKLILSLLLATSFIVNGQSPHYLNWVRNASKLYYPQSICRLSNGNNLVAVEVEAGMTTVGDGGFISTNTNGSILWHKTYQGYCPAHAEENGGSIYSTLSTTHGSNSFMKTNINN